MAKTTSFKEKTMETEFVTYLKSISTKAKNGCWMCEDAKDYPFMSAKACKETNSTYRKISREIAHRKLVDLGLVAKCQPLDKNIVGMHICDCKLCVNPNHINPGTQSENVSEAYKRGLRAKKVEVLHRNKKGFWKSEQDNIISMIKNGVTIAQIAEKYNVKLSALYNACIKLGINIVALKREFKSQIQNN